MKERIWHKGPPPHIGWWNASYDSIWTEWRWWNGTTWGMAAYPFYAAPSAAGFAGMVAVNQDHIEWTDYYPKNARVPRIDPRGMNQAILAAHEKLHNKCREAVENATAQIESLQLWTTPRGKPRTTPTIIDQLRNKRDALNEAIAALTRAEL